ncbi:hydroxyisourate hydrolase [Streptomyces sp. XM4193]|uniref:hydroxyisourate hydrolase n=1 Tax=Streptomyces sp. XM4193 TaxID=2929782 RepID=UPI001FFB282D|nr:hydroxyisourate hydrolase [Streptomyces sp. XM4193]MCK1797170.1 hydroxyisourate hydrolase [Streptomyces sp. XM4193]
MSTETTASVSTHILDTSLGRPAAGVAVQLSARGGPREEWNALGASSTDADGRCKDLPALPEGTAHVRLVFEVEPYFASRKAGTTDNAGATAASGAQPPTHNDDFTRQAEEQQDAPRARDSGVFFPEVTIVFAVVPGEHYHVPLLLNPFGYSVYRGS